MLSSAISEEKRKKKKQRLSVPTRACAGRKHREKKKWQGFSRKKMGARDPEAENGKQKRDGDSDH